MKRILFLFLLSPFFLQAQQGLIVTTAGDSILIEYSKIRSVTAPTRTARAVIMYDLTYIKYDVTYSFGKIMQDADCHLIEFVDVATGKYTAVPTTSIDQVKKKRGADNGYLFSEIENARADVVYEFRETFTSMKDYLVQCAEDLGGPFEGVYTEFSVTGVGLDDSRIRLVGDLDDPGSWMYYGTDGSGEKGWLSSAGIIDTAYFSNDSLFLVLTGGDTVGVLIDINLDFDSDREILRTPSVGTNIGGSTIHQWLEWWYFVAPTISVSSMTSPVEVGTSTTYNISGSTTNPGSATLSAGYFRQTAPSTDTLVSFGSATSYADTVIFTPQQGGTGQFNELTYTFQAKQDWVFGAESGTATASRTITAVYPVLYGMSATDFTVTGDPYTLTKLVQAEGNKTVTLTGSGFIYYLIPKTWSDFTLSQIIDHNGFNVTPSFTSYDVTVSSSGLVNDWSAVPYKLYKLNTTTTTSGYAYQFIR